MTMNDEMLGLMTWHDDQAMWTFEAGPIAGRSVRGAIFPGERRNPLAGVRLDKVRTCIQWIRENEPTVREYLVAEGFDAWRDNCGDNANTTICTPEEFRTRITLAFICFFYDGGKAMTVYEEGEQTIWVKVGPNGAFEPGVSIADRDFWNCQLR